MEFSLTWMPEVLLQVGLKVAPVPGWRTRGRGDAGATLGVLCHHTAGRRVGNMPALRTLVEGRRHLPGPLAQTRARLRRNVLCGGRGPCEPRRGGTLERRPGGNDHFIGVETENTGLPNDSPWPDVQMDAYRRGVAALLKHLQLSSSHCAGHKEFALPKGRKPDPSFGMQAFRNDVAALMAGQGAVRPPSPPPSPAAPGGARRVAATTTRWYSCCSEPSA